MILARYISCILKMGIETLGMSTFMVMAIYFHVTNECFVYSYDTKEIVEKG